MIESREIEWDRGEGKGTLVYKRCEGGKNECGERGFTEKEKMEEIRLIRQR